MKSLLVIPFLAFVGLSCSNPGKAEEFERKNLYQAQFFYEQGFPGRALEHAKRIKKSSSRFHEAQELIETIENESIEPGFVD